MDDSHPKIKRFVVNSLEKLTGKSKLNKIYEKVHHQAEHDQNFWKTILQELHIDVSYDQSLLDEIPKTGPLVVVANHPFGVVDGLILGCIISEVRSDISLLVNKLLCREIVLNKYLLPIDFNENKEAAQTNIHTKSEALKRLANNEVIAVFPAGGVATSKKAFGKAEDFEWKRFPAALIHKVGCPVLPIQFLGQNSRLFQIASKISMTARTGLFLNEIRNKMNKEVLVNIGQLIPYSTLKNVKKRQDLVNFLRDITFKIES